LNTTDPKQPESAAILQRLLAMARAAALAEMASGVAHELNQSLGAIATFAQAGDRLLNRPEPLVARALDVFHQINHEALGAGDSIQRVRRRFDQPAVDCSRQLMGHVTEELRPVLEMMARWAEAEFKIEVAATLPPVSIDSPRIQQVVFALFQNALDATLEGAPPRRVVLRVGADHCAVDIRISDSGPGVAEALRAHLFQPFFTTKPQGVGLGLACSKAAVEAHGGTIGFEANHGGGSCFWFRLPIAGPAESG